MLGYLIFAVASLLVLFANTAEAVIAIRAFLGIGGAMIMPTTLSLIRVIFTDPKERATALSIWAAVSGLGAAIGPLVGGFLLEHFSWHAAFLINVPLMVIGIIAGLMILPESRVSNPGKWDAVAAVLSLVGMTLLVWAIKQFGKESSFLVPEAWSALAIAGIAIVWFVLRCIRSDHPLLELRLFRNRSFSAGIIAALGTTFSMIAALLLIAQWLQLINGATPIGAGLRLAPIAVAGAVASLAAPPLARVIGARAVLSGTLGVAILGSISALMYRAELRAAEAAFADLGPERIDQAHQSLGAAMSIAETTGHAALAEQAGAAFNYSLQTTGFIGGAIMLAVAVLVFLMTPKGTDVSASAH